MIRFACPSCSATFSVDDSKAGKTGKCPKCQSQFVIPAAESPAPPPPAPASDGAVEIKPCPKCGSRLSVAVADLGVDVECPYCQAVYTAKRADAPDRPSRREEPRSEDRPSRRRDEGDEDRPSRRRAVADDEDDDRPRRRHRDDDDDDDDDRPRRRRRSGRRSREEAEAAVSGPAVAMMVIAGLGVLFAILNIFGLIIENQAGAAGQPPNPQPGFQAGFQAGKKVGNVVGPILHFTWSGIVLSGGLAMKRLGSRSAAKTGAIFAMLPCSPCCLIGIPVGIWALNVLGRPDVQDAMS